MSRNDKIIRKIQGLLKIAEDERNDKECQAAFLLAQKLMIEYQISQAEMNIETMDKETILEKETKDFKKSFWWEKKLAAIIGTNFRVKYFLKSRGRKSTIVFYGFQNDVLLAEEMYVLACDALRVHAQQFVQDYYSARYYYLNRDRTLTNELKNDYMNGFLEGIRQKFKEQYAVLSQKYKLMCLVPTEVEDAFKEKMSNCKVVHCSLPDLIHEAVFQEGYQHGFAMDFTKRTLAEGSEVYG